jgi:hypothetical protein
MSNRFTAKKKAGLVKAHASGFGGSGFKFDKEEDEKVKSLRKSTAKEYGIVESSESEDEDIRETTGAIKPDVDLLSIDKEVRVCCITFACARLANDDHHIFCHSLTHSLFSCRNSTQLFAKELKQLKL